MFVEISAIDVFWVGPQVMERRVMTTPQGHSMASCLYSGTRVATRDETVLGQRLPQNFLVEVTDQAGVHNMTMFTTTHLKTGDGKYYENKCLLSHLQGLSPEKK